MLKSHAGLDLALASKGKSTPLANFRVNTKDPNIKQCQSWNGIEPNVELRLDDMRLILFPRKDFEQMTSQQYSYPQGKNGTMELSFDVPTFADVDNEYTRAVEMGATPVFAPTTEPWGQRTCYIADPEGNVYKAKRTPDWMSIFALCPPRDSNPRPID